MNKLKGGLLAAAMFLVGSASLAFAACGGDKKETVVYQFNTDGGPAIENVTVEAGQEYTLPVPEREGYSFEGWYTNAEFTGEAVTTVSSQTSQTYYAKWARTYLVTLDAAGGTLDAPTVRLKEGADLYAAVKDYAPTLTDCRFDCWLIGGEALSETATMPAEDVTLTARYQVAYTVEIYLQTLTLDGYEKASETVTDYGYIGTEVTPVEAVTGFTVSATQDSVSTLVLKEKASDNVFRLYYNRDAYTVVFNSNYPDGYESERVSERVLYGADMDAPAYFALDGYCLAGWATSPSGDAVYRTGYIGELLYNKGEGNYLADKIAPAGNMALYAVWKRGYTDMFGGEDVLYLLDEDAEVIYLNRGGVFFEGTYSARRRSFYFSGANGETLTEGRLLTDGEYSYYRTSSDSLSSTLYSLKDGLTETTKIIFDGYNGLTFEQTNEDGTAFSSMGTYTIDEETGYYFVTYTSGALAGTTATLLVTTLSNRSVFFIRDESEIALGEILRAAVYEGGLVYFRSPYYTLELDGFYIATFHQDADNYSNYLYTLEDDALTLMTSSGQVALVARLSTINGALVYVIYDEDYDHTYVNGSDTLTLDGRYVATYTSGGQTVSGYYTLDESTALGDAVVTFAATSDGQTKNYTFLLKSSSQEITGEDGATETLTTYSFEVRGEGYAEYYLKDDSYVYYAPLMIFNETEAGKITVYGRTEAGVYEKVLYGSYILDEATGLYSFTAEDYFAAEVLTTPFDLSLIRSVVFSLGTYTSSSASYAVYYCYSVTTDEGTTNYDEQYTSSDGTATLTLIAGFAVYRSGETLLTGTYTEPTDGVIALTTSDGTGYFELNAESKTFVRYTTSFGTVRELLENGAASSLQTLTLDGKGGAVYEVKDEEGNVLNSYAGTFAASDTPSESGGLVYHFVSQDLTFDFIMLSTSSATYFSRYNAVYNGAYGGEGGASLTLDGFGYMATYIDANKNSHEGVYFISAEDVVCAVIDGEYRYFDLKANRTFTLRGTEYGTYLTVDNQSPDGNFVALDGYGAVTVFTTGTDDAGETVRVTLGEGTYEEANGGYRLTYTGEDGLPKSLFGRLSTIAVSGTSYNAFILEHDEIVKTYVNVKDYSVFVLDGYGNVTKYGTDGVAETGAYLLITGSLLYYVNDAADDAGIYRYDATKGTVTPVSFTETGYYTVDLESLLFSRYGYAIFNGTTRYYYDMLDDGSVVIYRQDASAANANEYGFVESEFGKFTDVKVFEEKTYYVNSGYALTFRRTDANSAKYPVLVAEDDKQPLSDLSFTPSGTASFYVSGTVKIAGTAYNCYITRTVADDGTKETYVTIGNYRFDVEITYTGEQGDIPNTYEITRMRRIHSFPSYTYLYYYYLAYMLYGQAIPNTIGSVSITYEYDEVGEVTENYFSGEFGESTGMYDSLGNLISLKKAAWSMSDDGLYRVEFTGEDGYDYRIYFATQTFSYLSTTGYVLYGFTRVETLTTADGFTVTAERIIASEASTAAYWSVALAKDGTELTAENVLILDGVVYYIVADKDEDGTVTGVTYYLISFTESSSGSVEEDSPVVLPYASVSVTSETVTRLYTADGKSYADIRSGDTVGFMLITVTDEDGNDASTLYYPTKTAYDAETKVYTVTCPTSGGTLTFTIAVGEDGTATITEIETPTESETGDASGEGEAA